MKTLAFPTPAILDSIFSKSLSSSFLVPNSSTIISSVFSTYVANCLLFVFVSSLSSSSFHITFIAIVTIIKTTTRTTKFYIFFLLGCSCSPLTNNLILSLNILYSPRILLSKILIFFLNLL